MELALSQFQANIAKHTFHTQLTHSLTHTHADSDVHAQHTFPIPFTFLSRMRWCSISFACSSYTLYFFFCRPASLQRAKTSATTTSTSESNKCFGFFLCLSRFFWSFIRVVALCASRSRCTHSAQWCEATVARNQNHATRGRNMKQKPTTKRLLIIFLKGTEKNFTWKKFS